jgi:hypothetical protein
MSISLGTCELRHVSDHAPGGHVEICSAIAILNVVCMANLFPNLTDSQCRA